MKKLILASIILFLFLSVNAQVNSGQIRNLTVKLPLSSLAGDIYAESMGVGIGVEKMLKPRFSFSQEIGYIFHINNTSMLSEDVESLNGLKFTTEIRKYLNRKEIPEGGFFASMELKNILTRSVQESWTTENTKVENDITRYRGLLTANLGVLFYWDQYKKSKITLELMAGGGLGYVNANSGVDTDYLTIKSDYNSAKGFYPWLNFDLKIGYILK